jgi:hypothetical protein
MAKEQVMEMLKDLLNKGVKVHLTTAGIFYIKEGK